jgi:Asp-tRNA(Asn)/Glu-tRNA(Gln) amidotransferase A subunit family amidase
MQSETTSKHPPPAPPLNEWPATELARGIAAGEFTCEAVVRACLARIADREPVVHAWTNFKEIRAPSDST